MGTYGPGSSPLDALIGSPGPPVDGPAAALRDQNANLSGMFDAAADWWQDQPWYVKLGAGVLGVGALAAGGLEVGAAAGIVGGGTAILGYGHGIADLLRRPGATSRDFFTHLTPGQAATLGAGFLVGRVAPGSRGAVHEGLDEALDHARRSRMPDWLRERLRRGREFDATRGPHYTALGGHNQVRLKNGKLLDSLIQDGEIVSRKYTQLGKVKPQTGINYLREIVNKYQRGEVIADAPANRQLFANRPELIGEPIQGDYVLEVPAQEEPIPQSVLNYATENLIRIRDTNGYVYN